MKNEIEGHLVRAGWSAKRIVVGRILLEEVSVSTQEGAAYLNNALTTLLESTRRRRVAGQSRFAEPLPLDTPSRLLSIEAADFLKDMKRRGLSQSAQNLQRHVFRLLALAAGDIPVAQINAQHIREFWEVVRWWPGDASKSKHFRHLSDLQILEEGKKANRTPPARGTINAFKRFLAVFFNRMLRMRVIAYSPLEAFGDLRDDLVDGGRRRPFTATEVNDIFDHGRFVPWAGKYPHRWWGPMLALYTGARAAEIGQLKVADVVCEGDTWCISFQKTMDEDLAGQEVRTRQKLKGKSSVRTIPIAAQLIQAGFLDFIEDARRSKHPRLFPHLPSGINRQTGELNGSGYGIAMSQQFSAFLKVNHGLEKGIVFHSFRHLFVTTLEEAGVSKELIATMTGHVIKKNVPVLETHYLHLRPAVLRQRQVEALAKFESGVQLPRYRPGQFAAAFRKDVRMYP